MGMFAPVRMFPAYRGGNQTPWGGEKLKTVYGKDIPEVPTGESLEISCIPGLESRDGEGRTLTELIGLYGEDYVGNYAGKAFPLLLKLLDARDALSVQVHPDDAYAWVNENRKQGKTEAWVILEAPEDAEIVYGIVPGTRKSVLSAACREGKAVEKLLRRVKVKAGDVCYIPAGCIHAIGAGITLYEIQQSSDVTYRFYDWDRTDAHGNRRELHLRQGLDVTDPGLALVPVHWERKEGMTRVLTAKHFALDMIRLTETTSVFPEPGDFALLTGLDGELTLAWDGGEALVRKGESFFIPHSAPKLTLSGNGTAALARPGE